MRNREIGAGDAMARARAAHEAGDRLRAQLARAEEKVRNLELALTSARYIGYAVGILMERNRLTPDDAFALLVATSQRTQRKLREVAEHLVFTGELLAA